MAECIAMFSVKSISQSTLARKQSTLKNAARHNLREIQAELGANSHIDPFRVNDNRIMAGPESAEGVTALAKSLLANVDTSKLKRNHCQAIEAVFSLPNDAPIDHESYFAACLAWLEKESELPVLSAVIHRDEATPHVHILLLPVKDGRYVGSAPIAKGNFKQLRESHFQCVAGPAGLKREAAKLRGVHKTWAVDAVLREWDANPLKSNEALRPVFERAIRRDPTDAMHALKIDVNSIRPKGDATTEQPTPNPKGFDASPKGFELRQSKDQSLSCVGFHQPATTNETADAPHIQPDRLSIARAAQQRGMAKLTRRAPPQDTAPVIRVGDDGITRVRDEYADDLSAWD